MPDTQETMAAVAAELSAAQPTETPAPTETPTETPQPETPATDTSNAPAPAKEEPGPAATVEDDEPQLDPSKPLPFEVHKRILERTRTKHSDELKKFDWAKDVEPTTVQQMRQLQQWMDADPVGFYEYYGGQLRRNGVLKEAPAAQPTTPQPPPDPKPEPDVLLTDGRLVYSAEGMDKLLSWQGRQFEKSVDARYGKFAQNVERENEDRRLNDQALQMLDDARTNWEGFREYEKDIAAYMANDGRATLQSAYRAIVPAKLKAQLASAREDARKELLAELKRQSVSTEAPGPVPQAGPRDYSGMSTAEVLRAEAQRLGFK